MKRAFAWIAVALALLVLGTGAAWFLLSRGDSVILENYERIRIGMTFEEVADLLGEPTEGPELRRFDERVTDHAVFVVPAMPADRIREIDWTKTISFWLGHGVLISVAFGPEGVSEKDFWWVVRPSLLQRARRWIGW